MKTAQPSVTFLSPYRAQGDDEMVSMTSSAMNWYTPRIAHALASQGREVEVLGPRASVYASTWMDGDVRVVPAYRYGTIRAPLEIFAATNRSASSIVHVQHELFAFGGLKTALGVPALFHALRSRRHHVVVTMHGVMRLETVTPEFAKANGIRAPIGLVRWVWRTLIRACCTAATIVHVHERSHEEILRHDYGYRGSVEVIPMGASPRAASVGRRQRRRDAAIPEDANVLVFFGFLLERKGIVPLLEAVPTLLQDDPSLVIVIAGDVPSRLASQSPVPNLIRRLEGHPRLRSLGFVEDARVPEVLEMADVVILPYTSLISASGPLSLALGAKRPVLLSNRFARDFPEAPLLFEPNAAGIAEVVRRFFSLPSQRTELETFCDTIGAERTWDGMAVRLGALYDRLGTRTT